MASLQERIKERRTSLNKTLLEVAEFVGVKEATMQRYESGEIKNIPHEKIVSIAEYLNCSPQYLMGWTDEINIFASNIIPLEKVRKVPLLGAIACGDPILAVENIDGYLLLPDGIVADFALRCQGDSMIDARILDGDIVFIKQQPTVENGEIAAVLIDSEATLKKFYYDGNSVVLQPENKNYPPMVYTGEDLNDIKIIGKAVAFLSRV